MRLERDAVLDHCGRRPLRLVGRFHVINCLITVLRNSLFIFTIGAYKFTMRINQSE